ncbi:MAG: MaoC/PaaZ C-terminal domain-containing protein [Burkholderiaceae bacterium]
MIDPQCIESHAGLQSHYLYDAKYAMSYALATGMGMDPMNQQALSFCCDDQRGSPLVLPTSPIVMGWVDLIRDPRSFDASLGIDPERAVVGQVSFTLHRPMKLAGMGRTHTHFGPVVDKGQGKGALICVRREVYEESEELLATIDTWMFIRGAGGFGGQSEGGLNREKVPDRLADVVSDIHTSPQQALLYRLMLNDHNRVHSDPVFAKNSGFERPILHGLATFSMAVHQLLMQCTSFFSNSNFQSFTAQASLIGPVFPGDTLRTEIWKEFNQFHFRMRAPQRDAVVLDSGIYFSRSL